MDEVKKQYYAILKKLLY